MDSQNILDQNLINAGPGDGENAYKFTDKLYHQAYKYFLFGNYVSFIYAFFRVIILPYFISRTESSLLSYFLISFFCVSLIQLYDYFLMKQQTKNKQNYYNIAQQLSHMKVVYSRGLPDEIANAQYRVLDTYDLTNLRAEESEGRIKVVALQIKYRIQQSSNFLIILGSIQFFLYQLVHLWGFSLLLTFEFQLQSQKSLVMVMIVLGTYQYLQFYLFVAILILVLPFFCLNKLYLYLKTIYLKHRMFKNLNTFAFQQNEQVKGDRECQICLMPYERNEDITQLKCSQYHHFHSQCIKSWLETSTTCPLCRADIANS